MVRRAIAIIKARLVRRPGSARLLISLAAAGLLAAAPAAHAQQSAGFKFLEAVKKKDGTAVTDALAQPGNQLVNTRDLTSGQSALHIVTERRDATWIGFLLAKGANPDIRDRRGATPLMIAANLGFLEGVEALLARKASVDVANDAGETPLIGATHRRDLPLMRALLKAGADPDRTDNSGRSARDYARLQAGGQSVSTIEANALPADQRPGAAPAYGPSI